MKRLVFILVLPLIPFFSNAQNWTLINPEYQYNYRLADSTHITNVIVVDSSEVEGTESTYFLNRTAHIQGTNYQFPQSILINLPQFLQRKCILSQTNWNFRDPGNIVFPKNPTEGSSWTLDSLQLIEATLDAVYLTENFNYEDSVRRIVTSENDTILWSKAYGLLQFPKDYGDSAYYRLTGIDGLGIGEHYPTKKDFYPYQPGDKLEFASAAYYTDASYFDQYAVTITDRQETDFTITFIFSDSNSETDSATYHLNKNLTHEIQDGFPNQLVPSLFSLPDGFFNNYCYFMESVACFDSSQVQNLLNDVAPDGNVGQLTYAFSLDNKLLKTSIPFLPNNPNFYFDTQVFEQVSGSDSTYVKLSSNIENPLLPYIEYLYPVGDIHLHGPFFEGQLDIYLTRYISDGDTIYEVPGGVVPNGLTSIDRPERLQIYPNPATDRIHFQIPDNSPTQVQILDISGKTILKTTLNGKHYLTLSSLKSGFYLIKIRQKSRVFVGRFIKT